MTLSIRGLEVSFKRGNEQIFAVNGVDLDIADGETVCIVGESGSGKSITAMSVLGLLPPNKLPLKGSINWNGKELVDASDDDFQAIRGSEIAMIFQDPLSSLNPVLRVETQVGEAVNAHKNLGKKELKARVLELLKSVGLPDVEHNARAYPHELSGGMRQRVMIAMAIANEPKLLIADEPTTALDVTIQAQVLELLKTIQQRSQISVLFVTHDLGVVAGIADRVAVMYGGRIVETGDVDSIFADPRHPYTKALFAAQPRLDQVDKELVAIPGHPRQLREFPSECVFAHRCPFAVIPGKCEELQVLAPHGNSQAACWRADELVGELK